MQFVCKQWDVFTSPGGRGLCVGFGQRGGCSHGSKEIVRLTEKL